MFQPFVEKWQRQHTATMLRVLFFIIFQKIAALLTNKSIRWCFTHCLHYFGIAVFYTSVLACCPFPDLCAKFQTDTARRLKCMHPTQYSPHGLVSRPKPTLNSGYGLLIKSLFNVGLNFQPTQAPCWQYQLNVSQKKMIHAHCDNACSHITRIIYMTMLLRRATHLIIITININST